ncbi:rhamnosyl/mannosyltransferase [Marinitoga hydrogenitolerans DSM 16785]|uniref:Rhamnosyl/mannosyltransferase n=1 Tax=Marinitoga hydrogenitolerans (strain DSM 16785 / JCM 12826 / AT1271) TaxID=1122195 RepID=A0A1M4Y550_MARH1|nr:glycosyltransferase [Marinitoga hydrogenitolerans]SHF00572.1 rhamnosyl/mannosyltransferase [Marinitoga hydrogenitolerans DSM 16785]
MNFLTVNKMYYPEIGGVEIVAKKIAEIAKNEGFNSEVLTFNVENIYIKERINNIDVYRLPSIFRKDPIRWSNSYRKKLNELAQKSEILLFHFPSFQPEMEFFILNKYRQNKKICFYHADIVGKGIIGNIYNNIFVENYLKKMNKIIVTSPNILKTSPYLQKYKYKIDIIPLFVDTEHFYYRQNNKRNYLLNKFKAAKDSKLILYIGRFGRYKGLDYLIKSLLNLPKNVFLILIGNGPKKDVLEKLVKVLNLKERVLFLNHISYEELPYYYNAADIFVLPSIDRGEAFGLVGLEAMACGVPVITTELGTGTSFYNLNHITGEVIKPQSSDEISKTILDIINNKYTYDKNEIIKRANEFSLEKFYKNVKEKILNA